MTLIVDEVMLREPNLLVPGKKPIGPVKINWGHPLSDGLMAFTLLESLNPYIYGLEVLASTQSGVLTTVTQDGYGIETTASQNDYISLGSADALFPDSDKTTIVLIRRLSSSSPPNSTSFGYHVSNGSRVLANLPHNGNYYFDYGSTTTGRTSISVTVAAVYEVLIFVAGSSKGREIWQNGVRIASTPTSLGSRPLASSSDFYIGSAQNSGVSPGESIYAFGIFDSEWSDIKCIEFTNNPYQFLIPA